VRLFLYAFELCRFYHAAFSKHLKPENSFVGFFNHYTDLGNKFSLRPGSTCRSIVSGHSGCRSQDLVSDYICFTRSRKSLRHSNYSQSKLLSSGSQFLMLIYAHASFSFKRFAFDFMHGTMRIRCHNPGPFRLSRILILKPMTCDVGDGAITAIL
jgi:hypothetical protein